MATAPHENQLADRFREMTRLWHTWRSCMLEDPAGVPPELDVAVGAELAACLAAARSHLQEACEACDSAMGSIASTRSAQ